MKTYDNKAMAMILAVLFAGLHISFGADSSVVPKPAQLRPAEGSFVLSRDTIIVADDACAPLGGQLRELLAPATGYPLRVETKSGTSPKNSISLALDADLGEKGAEGYTLSVTEDGAAIRAASRAGIFNGIQTLRQLLPAEIETKQALPDMKWEIPCLEIRDWPRLEWRGLMIDCSRTFWSKDYIKRIIRLMSIYKLNRLHLHLTDDQGWRLEIKKYPRLTEFGSRFHEKYNEPEERQGYYTQDDMREIIEYAQRHNVLVVPEIEMPGHTLAALLCYPELSCTGKPFDKIHPYMKESRDYRVHKDIFCAGNEQTFEFLENVLSEVAELFPSKFIHIGGDEAPKHRWKECPKCQARMAEEGLKTENQLQSYFIERIGKFLKSKGKVMIGWDEIRQGGLPAGAAVMSWHGTGPAVDAARKGHDAVMTPTSHCYFDYGYGRTPTMKVYSFNPVPERLEEEHAKHILGAQANLWTHRDRSEAKADQKLFPRLLAMAEVTWSDASRDPDDFKKRVISELKRLDLLGVNRFEDPSLAE